MLARHPNADRATARILEVVAPDYVAVCSWGDKVVHGWTVREIQVLGGLAGGLTYSMIAEELGLSYWTIKTYAARLHVKLGAHNQAHMVAKAIRLGLL